MPNLLEALSVDGELHQIWESVTVNTMAARVSDVGDGNGLTPYDYDKIKSESSRYTAVFEAFMTADNLLQWVADAALTRYVDRASASCSFTDPSFAALMEWCAEMGSNYKEGSSEPSYKADEAVLSLERISVPERLRTIRENFGEEFCFVGFPDGGCGISYYSCGDEGCMAILSNSKNKNGAWAYIKGQLSTDKQLKLRYTLPVNIEALKRIAAEELNDEEIAQLVDLLERTESVQKAEDIPLRDIVLSAGRAYLHGDKTLEQSIQLIQSQASLYMSEQYG